MRPPRRHAYFVNSLWLRPFVLRNCDDFSQCEKSASRNFGKGFSHDIRGMMASLIVYADANRKL
jgi:hypothetical protein